VAQHRGKLKEAEDLYQQSLDIKRQVGDRPGEARSLHQLGLVANQQGDLGLGVERIEQAHRMFEEMGLREAEHAKGDLDGLRKRLEEERGVAD